MKYVTFPCAVGPFTVCKSPPAALMTLWMIGLLRTLEGTFGIDVGIGLVGSASAVPATLKHRTPAINPTNRVFMAMERNGPAPGSATAVRPVPASSVLLLRPAEHDPFEVFMVRRAAGGLWPHLHVFPGGSVHETDGGSYESAAVRELFEEAAIRVGTDELVAFSHWITPESLPRRFDTKFFLARAPADQIACCDGIETTDGCWISPRDALLRFGEGTFPMIYPTIKHLERLLLFRNLDELFAFARAKAIRTVVPKTYDGEAAFVMNRGLEHRW